MAVLPLVDTVAAVEPESLRERKKSETRERLVQAALELFTEHGFDAVTIDQIAALAETSPRTFFRYFGSKEAVLFADQDELLEVMRHAITSRPADEPPLVALREALIVASEHHAQHRAQHLQRARLAESGAAVAAYQRAVLQPLWEEMLAEAIAERLDVDVDDDLRPRLLSGVAIAVMSAIGGVWVARDGQGDIPTMFRQAFTSLDEAAAQSLERGPA